MGQLEFKKANKAKEVEGIFGHTVDAFSDTPDFNWQLDEIKSEIKDGWDLFGVTYEGEVIAALFVRADKRGLLTKNTAIKMSHQGSGFSHKIKEFYEELANDLGIKKIFHYCRIDNFRMYSLNEGHNYKKTGQKFGPNDQIVEWEKTLS